MRKSAADNILDFLKENPVWFASGALQRMEWRNKDNTFATPRSIVRRLEEMVEDGLLDVEYRGKHAAHYKIKQEHRKVIYRYEPTPDGSMREIREYA